MTDYWFLSDPHFSHRRIIEFANRPFQNAEEMNETIIANINSRVKKNDYLYLGGDFAFSSQSVDILNRLNGKIFFVFGNHDHGYNETRKKKYKNVIWWGDIKNITIDKQPITICHYPMVSWHKSHYGAWSLYGHHHSDVSFLTKGKSMNICVDVMGFFPVNYEQVKAYMQLCPDNWNMVKTEREALL